MYSFDECVLIWLNSFDGFYSNKQHELLSLYGSPSDLFENLKDSKDVACKVISSELFEKLAASCDSQKIFDVAQRLFEKDIVALTIFSDKYPQKLKEIDVAPTVLYCKGDIDLLDKTSISIVGSRKCTPYGKKVARYYVKELVENGFVIISGLALGIDETAHRAAIEFDGKTIAVLGAGFNHIYPSGNKALAEKISRDGLLVTEFAPDISPQPYHFPMRNRIITGLCDALLIAEAGKKSGTQTTLEHALNQGKRIYIVPNDIFSFNSSGSNEMLKTLQGALTTTPKDILEDFGISQNVVDVNKNIQLNIDEAVVVKFLKNQTAHFNTLLENTGFSVGELQYILSALEIKGIVIRQGGNFYKLTMEV